MAKKKAEAVAPKKKTGPKPSPLGRRTKTVGMKAYDAYYDWVQELAEHLETTPAIVITKAINSFAEANKFPNPPPKR